MPFIGRRIESFSLEDVTQVSSAVRADDLCARHAKGAILVAGHGAWDGVEVCRPAAARLELVVGLVERCAAPCASVDTLGRVVLVIFTGARGLGALLSEDAELLCKIALEH